MNKAAHILIATGLGLGIARGASATDIADITRLDAQREERLTGMGLVLGLNGTGDGGKFQPAIRSLAQMLEQFGMPAGIAELSDVDNIAIVALSVTVPENGVRDGDQLDVHVLSVGAAKSLEGGRLFVTPLTGPLPRGGGIFAFAEGGLVLEDPTIPTVARIEGGCIMEADLPKRFVHNGQFTLVLNDAHASWTASSNIAKVINETEGFDNEEIAVAIDPKNVIVTIPRAEQARPDAFISRVQQLPIPLLADEARVRINERLGTIVISGDVEISPAVISMNGLTITTSAPNASGVTGPTPAGRDPFAGTGQPQVSTGVFVPVDTQATQRQRAQLNDLVMALDRLNVPAQDRISILKELHRLGKLHAKLIIE